MNRFWERGSPVVFIVLVVAVSSLIATYRHYHTQQPTAHSIAWHKCYEQGALQIGGDVMRNCVDFEQAHLTGE